MPSARLLALLGAAALVRAQEVTLPVVSPTDTAILTLPTEGAPSGTETQPTFSDTVITSVPETLTLSTDLSITEPSTTATATATATGSGSGDVTLPWITSGTTFTTTNQVSESTTVTLHGPSTTGTGGGSGNWTLTTSTGTNSAGEPTTITTQITSTATDGGSGGDSPTATNSDGGDAGATDEPGTGAAPRVEAAAGLGLAAIVAGLLAL